MSKPKQNPTQPSKPIEHEMVGPITMEEHTRIQKSCPRNILDSHSGYKYWYEDKVQKLIDSKATPIVNHPQVPSSVSSSPPITPNKKRPFYLTITQKAGIQEILTQLIFNQIGTPSGQECRNDYNYEGEHVFPTFNSFEVYFEWCFTTIEEWIRSLNRDITKELISMKDNYDAKTYTSDSEYEQFKTDVVWKFLPMLITTGDESDTENVVDEILYWIVHQVKQPYNYKDRLPITSNNDSESDSSSSEEETSDPPKVSQKRKIIDVKKEIHVKKHKSVKSNVDSESSTNLSSSSEDDVDSSESSEDSDEK